MIQFTTEEIERLRLKAKEHAYIIDLLKDKSKALLEGEAKVPRTGIATWSLYYYCPDHSEQLIFDYNKPKEHVCPVDKKVFTGEPYDGSWWVYANNMNAECCVNLGLLRLLTGDKSYSNLAKEVLRKYAEYYPDYEVHGNIPHNQPGKIFSQTMNDAQWIRRAASAYDLIADDLSASEKKFIESRLFRPCAEYLMERRLKQTHNHEVLISSAIAIVGILLNDDEMIEFAIHSDYGLNYHLKHAVLKDYMWFEGSFHYQFYVIEQYQLFEKFARFTKHSIATDSVLKNMHLMPIQFIQPDAEIPLINDDIYKGSTKNHSNYYEFAYSLYKSPEIAWYLNKFYEKENSKRKSIESFVYGVDSLPKAEKPEFNNYHNSDGSGLSILRSEEERYLLIKHSPFSGEHDHYDRLSLSYLSHGKKVGVDLGTTGYGAKLHYDYYKNTGTHNTVVINEENHAPANPSVIEFKETEDHTIVDTQVKWEQNTEVPDCHTRVEWDEESYKGVRMRRKIIWCKNYFIDIFLVDGVQDKSIDWVFHVNGELVQNKRLEAQEGSFSDKKPFSHLSNVQKHSAAEKVLSEWKLEQCKLRLHSYTTEKQNIYYAKGPDNPSSSDVSYIINRTFGKEAAFINVFESYKGDVPFVSNVEFLESPKGMQVSVTTQKGKNKYVIEPKEF